jgi:LEA14-like dessication related protein
MKKVFFAMPIIILSALMLSSCAVLQGVISDKVKEPKVDFVGAKISGLSLDAVDLLFDLKIQNPNSVGVKLAGFDYDFLLDGNQFVKGNQDKGIDIPSQGEETIQLPLSLKYTDIYRTFQNLREQGVSNYQIKCGFSFDVPVLGVIRIPVSKSGEVPMIKLPKLSFGSLKLDRLTMTGADLKLSLKLNNPNVFSMLLGKMQYNFKLNEQSILSGLTDKSMQISEKSDNIIEIPVSVDFLRAGTAVYQILNGNKILNYQLGGNLDLSTSLPLLGQVNLPFELSGRTDLMK